MGPHCLHFDHEPSKPADMDAKIVILTVALCVHAALGSVIGPQYSYGYSVGDALTGDYKSHAEQRAGDLVTGSYSVLEADGSRRVVQYSADALNGFNAVVRREPPLLHAPVPAPLYNPYL